MGKGLWLAVICGRDTGLSDEDVMVGRALLELLADNLGKRRGGDDLRRRGENSAIVSQGLMGMGMLLCALLGGREEDKGRGILESRHHRHSDC